MPLAPAVAGIRRSVSGHRLTGGSWIWPPGSTGGPCFPRHSSSRASWCRATRSYWRGSGRRRQAAAGLAHGRDAAVDPVADLDGDRRPALLHSGAAAGHADHHIVHHCILLCPNLRRSSKISTCLCPGHDPGHRGSHFLIKYGLHHGLDSLVELALLVFLPFSFLAWGNYNIPFFDRLLGRRHTALVLRSLASHGRRGQADRAGLVDPGTTTIRPSGSAAGCDGRRRKSTRGRLDRVAPAAPPDPAVRSRGAPSAAAVGNLAWALMELAETAERRLATRDSDGRSRRCSLWSW